MKGHVFADFARHFQLAIPMQCGKQLAVMQDLVVATIFLEVIFDGVEAVRAVGDNLFELECVELFNIAASNLGKAVLVAQTLHGFTVALLCLAQDRKIRAAGFENFHNRTRHFLVSGII